MKENIPRLIQELTLRQQSNVLKLSKSSKLSDLPDGEVKDSIEYGYKSENIFHLTLAVLMNAIISSKKKEFILSRVLLTQCFERDPNVENREFSGEQIKRLIGSISEIGLIERTSEATTKGGPKRKAAKYKVVLPELLALL